MSFDQITCMWSNGQFVEWRDASVHISTHTLHLGSGVFEAIRCYETNNGPAVFRLDAHLNRLYASASIHGIEIPYPHLTVYTGQPKESAAASFQQPASRPRH